MFTGGGGLQAAAGFGGGGGGGAFETCVGVDVRGVLPQRLILAGAASVTSSGVAGRGLMVMVITFPPAV